MSNKKIIVCDIDNTVSNQEERFLRNYDMKQRMLMQSAFNKNEILKDNPIKDSVECINRLSKDFEIVWVSARKKAWFNTTYTWLRRNGFPHDQIHLVEQNDNKIPVLEELDPLVFIDDMKYNWENLDPKPCTNFMKELEIRNINYEIFDNNWKEIVNKYN